MATKKRTGDDDWEKELGDEAEKEAGRERSGASIGNVISIKGRKFTFGGESLGREMKCIVVDFVYLNSWYSSSYNEDAAHGSIPSCFSLSDDGEHMEPHENSPKPQSSTCEGCPNNEWGSGGKRRKACRQGRKLAVIHMDDAEDADAIAGAEVAIINMPPTSVKRWGMYVKDVKAQHNRPYWSVVTTLSFDDDSDYPILEFETDDKLDKELALAVKARREEVRELLMTPFTPQDDEDDEDEKPTKKGKKPAAKPAPKKAAKPKDDEDDEDLDDEDDEDDDEEEAPTPKKRGKKKAEPEEEELEDEDDEDEEDEDEEDEDEEDEDEEDEDDEEDEEPAPKKSKGSRFRRKK